MARFRLREFGAHDARAVAALHARTRPQCRWRSEAARAAYFVEALLGNPWTDPQLPSWIAEDEQGLVGFIGVMPRHMRLGTRPVRIAVACQLMVDPARRASLAALELMRRFFSGPQDLSVADEANEVTRQCWEALGGTASPLHSLRWVRLLRPMQGALVLASTRPALRSVRRFAAPLAALVDACTPQRWTSRAGPALREDELDPGALAAAMQDLRGGFTLRPHYDARSLEWLLRQTQEKRRDGPLHGCLLREQGRLAGWFLYHLNAEMSRVLQIGARRERVAAVMQHLFQHARARGAAAIEGRLEPHLVQGLKGSRCLLQSRGAATLVHARDSGLLLPFLRGDALFTRLDGEWWMRFSGDAGSPSARVADTPPISRPASPAQSPGYSGY